VIARATASAVRARDENDRVFLDANVLFSAAYREGSALERLWQATYITLLSSPYAIEEANRNLEERDPRTRLQTLVAALEIVPDAAGGDLPTGVSLPEKDRPILLAAIAAVATHLLTGDRAHFGAYFGRRISGVLIQRPGDYLAAREAR
jgi:predicted nucleic acid-binding protein